MAHAFFSPSASSRWLSCTASLSIDVSHLKRSTSYAAEMGTALHECGEQLLQNSFTPAKAVGRMFNGIKITKEHVKDVLIPYIDFVKTECKNEPDIESVIFFTESKSVLVPDQCWGTADVVIVLIHTDGTATIKIIDLKTGSGFKVSPIDNSQLMIYAAGIYRDLELVYDIREVQAGICQPPFDVYAMRTIPQSELNKFAVETINTIEDIRAGVVEYDPSENNCRWCPAAGLCPRLTDAANKAAAVDFKKLPKSSAKSLAENMAMVPLVLKWAKAVQEEASSRLLDGKKVKGYKVVRGRNSRAWKFKQDTLEKRLSEMKIPKTWWNAQKFLSPPQMEALLKEKGKDIDISKLVKIVPGNPTVASENDNREAFDPAAAAKEDFMN